MSVSLDYKDMVILRDYKEMIEDKYIRNKSVFTMEIKKLQNQLTESTSIENTLRIMNSLLHYKKVLNMTIYFYKMKDKKYPDNMYIHARGALTLSTRRLWVSHYVGKKDEVTDDMKKQASIELMKKAIKSILT